MPSGCYPLRPEQVRGEGYLLGVLRQELQDLQPHQDRLRGVLLVLRQRWEGRMCDREPESVHLYQRETLPKCAQEERPQVDVHDA